MRKVSLKRAKWLRDYAAAKRAADDIQTCPVCGKTEFKRSLDCHHIEGRSTKEKLLNFIFVHRHCHQKIHDNGKWARAEGFLK
jgi:hypothetical protein